MLTNKLTYWEKCDFVNILLTLFEHNTAYEIGIHLFVVFMRKLNLYLRFPAKFKPMGLLTLNN